MNKELHLHDISDSTSEKTKPHIIEKNGVFWTLRTGKPWRDLPAECGYWKNVPSALIDGASFECLASLFY